jgi:hypothetical protein
MAYPQYDPLRHDPLSSQGRAQHRNLLVVISAIALMVELLTPTRLSALGVDIEADKRAVIRVGLAVVIAYLIVAARPCRPRVVVGCHGRLPKTLGGLDATGLKAKGAPRGAAGRSLPRRRHAPGRIHYLDTRRALLERRAWSPSRGRRRADLSPPRLRHSA